MTSASTPYPIPDAALAQHIAVVGKTGSGKTNTEKTMVEHLVAQGARVCVLDPLKSDWWGITSSADGEAPGLPFQILGGPRGHVPLHMTSGSAIADLVASGELPLSIVDMRQFGPGGVARFFVDFAPVLMERTRGVVHLVMEEAHVFAPKERAGFGAENLSIHWAKMLATAGRSAGVRLILATQRTQALHNALLGSCETMVVHRLTAPADQKPVIDWLKANVQKNVVADVTASLSSLPSGTAWVCSGEAQLFECVQFPRIKTFDNSATPTGEMAAQAIKTAPVDVEKLREAIGEAIAEADANDPKKLKEEIATLRKQLQERSAAAGDAATSAARAEGYNAGYAAGEAAAEARAEAAREALEAKVWSTLLGDMQHRVRGAVDKAFLEFRKERASPAAATADARTAAKPLEAALSPLPQAKRAAAPGSLEKGPRAILAAMAWWREAGIVCPDLSQVSWMAGYARGATFDRYRSALSSAGLVHYPASGCMALTPEGRAAAPNGQTTFDPEELRRRVQAKLAGPVWKLLQVLIRSHPDSVSLDELAAASGYSRGGTFDRYRSTLSSLGMATYPSQGRVRAADWLFPERGI